MSNLCWWFALNLLWMFFEEPLLNNLCWSLMMISVDLFWWSLLNLWWLSSVSLMNDHWKLLRVVRLYPPDTITSSSATTTLTSTSCFSPTSGRDWKSHDDSPIHNASAPTIISSCIVPGSHHSHSYDHIVHLQVLLQAWCCHRFSTSQQVLQCLYGAHGNAMYTW